MKIRASKLRQAGISLIEVIVSLAILATVIGGALALGNSGTSSANTIQFSRDIAAIYQATKQVYNGQGGYGTGSLNAVLRDGRKIPTTMSVSGATITHSLNGTVAIEGNTTNFTITVTNVPADVCLGVVSGASGYLSVQVGSNAAITTFPVSPTTASGQCAGSAQTLIFTAA
jgi:type II secretory pathway pseudopilin PulG